ncbi:hypothetical protein Tco_1101788 [Tanacetum coccineum]
MKDRVCSLSKNDLKDLVNTYRIPLDLHPRLPDPGFTMDHLPAGAIGIYFEFLPFSSVRVPFSTFLLSVLKYFKNDVERLCAHLFLLHEMREEVLVRSGLEMSIYNFMTLPSWSEAKIVKESHHLSLPLLERVPSHTIAPATEGAIIPLPTPDEIVVSLLDSHLVKKSKGHSQVSRPSKKRKLQKRASEAGSSAPERLGAPPSIAVVSAHEPSHVGISTPASTSDRSLSLGGVVASGCVGKSGAEYDQILDDDFGTATRGEEIDLTLFPLAPGLYHMHYPYGGVSYSLYTKEEWDGPHGPESNILCKDIFKDPDVCKKALDQTITPAELRRTEYLLLLELSNLLVSHGYELNSHYTNLVSSKALLQEKLNQKKWDVRLLHSEVTSLDDKLEKLQGDYDDLGRENRVATDAKLSEQALIIKDLQNELALEKSKSQGYKDAMDGLREEGLRMRRTDVEFEAAVHKFFNFHAGAKADFNKALVDFPTTPFSFLSKIVAASGGTLFDVAQILSDKFIRSATSVSVAPSSVNKALEQVSP